MDQITIIGAGMAGLLAGALNPGSIIYEAGPDRELDHKAVFRCKSPKIGDMLGMPFKEVTVHKSIWYEDREVHPSPRFANWYSQKVTGLIANRSIYNIASGKRYIPPIGFFEQLKKRCNIRYNTPYKPEYTSLMDKIISTISMEWNLKLFGLDYIHLAEFNSAPIYVNRYVIPDCDTYCTVYYPEPAFSAYRASINRDILIIEGHKRLQPGDIEEVRLSLGLSYPLPKLLDSSVQKFGKITPINNTTRENIITDLTIKNGVYSLGRFATWRPKLMLDDVLEDIFVIKKLMAGTNYSVIKYRQGEKS